MALKLKATPNKGFEDFSAMCRQLADFTGASMKEVIDGEFAAVLQHAADNTKIASPNKIISDHNKQKAARYDIPYAGSPRVDAKQQAYFASKAAQRRGKAQAKGKSMLFALRPFVSGASKDHGAGHHKHPEWLWSQIVDRRRASLAKKLSKAGIALKHIWFLAQQLGISINVDPRARSAQEKYALNVVGSRATDKESYFVMGQIVSRHAVVYAGIGRAIRNALRDRARGMDKAMVQWAKGKIHFVAKRYPHLLRVS